jgi:AcrR family transcriptional regulator
METTRKTILDHACRLSISLGEVPSLNALAKDVGISKGGLMHHFPSRDALLNAMVVDGIDQVDVALKQAGAGIETLRTWLKLSIPDKTGIALFQSMAAIFFAGKSDHGPIQELVVEATKRWEVLLKKELGSVQVARTAMLLGDGLLFGAISGSITEKNAAAYLSSAEAAVAALSEVAR